ncbi:TrbI/VirB10 family protein [Acidithiobacillus sp.]|uniref:TrbI/VirB10 family protein n=1 Tax=Acidithiobacillus sp. TaxID=1872118 RepID=UPI003D0795A6
MKSGKELVSGLFRKKSVQGPLPDSSKGPQVGKPGIEIKPDREQMATRIKKTPLYVAAAVVGLGAYGGYEYLQSHPMFGGSKPAAQPQKIAPASGNGAPPPPAHPKQQYHRPTTPGGASGSASTAPAKSEASQQSAQPGQKPTAPQKNPYAVQDAAFAAALGTGNAGESNNTLTWKTPTAKASTPPETTLPEGITDAAQEAMDENHGTKAHKTITPLVTRETSPYELLSGSVIPAVLQTGIKSYLPGQIVAVVSRNVYSSVNGATLLIPAGARLVGTYDTQTALGINRLAVAWTRIEFPNGTTMDLPGYEGAGGSGYAGFAGEVNDHTWLIFRNALLLSIVNAGMAIASPTSTSTNTTGVTGNQALQDSEQSLAQTFGEAESQLLEKYIDIAPTITIHPGYLFSVVVAHDMIFPGPYDPAMQTGSSTVRRPLGPRPNPYG